MAPKASKVLKTIMKKPAAMAEEPERTKADKGNVALMAIEAGKPMGKNAAQAIQDTLKKLKREDPDHPGLEIDRGLKSAAQKRIFGVKLNLDRTGAFCTAMQKDGLRMDKTSGDKSGWLALWEIAKIEGIPWTGDDENVRLMAALVEDLEEKDHPKPSLAKLHWKVYYYTKKLMETTKKTRFSEGSTETVRKLDSIEDRDQMMDDARGAMDELYNEEPRGSKDPAKSKRGGKKSSEEKEAEEMTKMGHRQDAMDHMTPGAREKYTADEDKREFSKRTVATLKRVSKYEAEAEQASLKLATLLSEKKLTFVSDKFITTLTTCQKNLTKHRTILNKVISEADEMDWKKYMKERNAFSKKVDAADAEIQVFTEAEGLKEKFNIALKMKMKKS
jgi:hypothetical protein